MISGSDDSHWYHIEVTVKETDRAKKTLVASVPENDFFDSEEILVDCKEISGYWRDSAGRTYYHLLL